MTLDPGLCWDPGDFILVFNGHGNNSVPALGSGMTAAVGGGSQAAGPLGHRSGYRFLQAGDASSSGWGAVGEQNMIAVILRGVHATTPIGRAAGNGGSGSTANFPALPAPLLGGSSSWVFGGVHSTGSAASIATPPTGMTNLDVTTSETVRRALHCTNGPVSAWSSQNVVVGSGGAYQTTVIEIRAAGPGNTISLRDVIVDLDSTLNLPAACVAAERFMVAYLG